MEECNHEEADTRVLVHLLHAVGNSSTVMIMTGDTDVIVILLSNFHQIMGVNSEAEIWVSFHSGKTSRLIHLNSLAHTLGETTCKSLALFHSFTGCDSTSSIKYKGKRICYKTFLKESSVVEQFSQIIRSPFQTTTSLIQAAQRFVCLLYDKDYPSNGCNDVDMVRFEAFCRRTKDVERIPPTNDALMLHLKRSVYQASIWALAYQPQIPAENPEQHGWMIEDNKLVPVWKTLPLAKDVFNLEVKCTCSGVCSSCKCIKTKLKCTRMCKCKCTI